MPAYWCNVRGLNKLRAKWRAVRGELAVVVLGGVLDPVDIETLVAFLRTTLEANDYRIYVDPGELQEEDPFGTACSVFRPFVRSGRLLPFEMICMEPSVLPSAEPVFETSAR
jgi:hypothetical protein